VKHELERVEIPGESEARERSRAVLAREFEARVPTPQRSHWPRVAAVAIALAALLASAFSSPGRAVIDEIREVVGVERAERALFSLPSEGRLLVTSDTGVWVVQPDGSKRRLGEYLEASWSPFGRFVVAARRDELLAVEPDGDVRWSLARPEVRSPRWSGTETDTRIAYSTRDRLNLVGGDGQGDLFLFSAPDVPTAPFAWVPGSRRFLAHATQGVLRLLDIGARGEEVWSARVEQPLALMWTDDGRRLAAVSPSEVAVFDSRGRRVVRHELAGRATAAAIRPGSHSIAIAMRARGGQRAEILTLSLDRGSASRARLFAGAGSFDRVAWSPDARWLLVSWPAADQWVFVRTDGGRIRAVADVSAQFGSRSFPRVEGWCCAR
jgi:hypothetical protein